MQINWNSKTAERRLFIEAIQAKLIYSGDYDPLTEIYPIIGKEEYDGRGLFDRYERELVKPTQ